MSLDCLVFTADVSGLSSVYCWYLWIVQCLLLISLDCLVFTADISGLSSVYCWCLWIVQCLLLMSLDCPVLIASSVFVLYIVWVCPLFTADVSGLSSFYFLFCLRPVYCVSVSSVYCWCLWIVQCLLLMSPDCPVFTADVSGLSSLIKTGQSRDISSKHWTHLHKIQNENRRGNKNWTIQRHQQ
jgi:hypothetical protein